VSRPASRSRSATVWVGLAAFCLGSALWLFPALPAVPASASAAAVHYPWTAGFGLGLTLLGVTLLALARWLPGGAGQ
jgi:predicted cobalt transporter CbtA